MAKPLESVPRESESGSDSARDDARERLLSHHEQHRHRQGVHAMTDHDPFGSTGDHDPFDPTDDDKTVQYDRSTPAAPASPPTNEDDDKTVHYTKGTPTAAASV